MSNTKLVINYHITEKCNYDCQFCFAKWENPNEIHAKRGLSEQLIDQLASYYIGSGLQSTKVRLNFAGGEPLMLGKRFIEIVSYAKQQGFELSLITNGHYLTTQFIEQHSHYFSIIGISYDSQDLNTQRKIGRIDRKNNQLTPTELARRIKLIRHISPNTEIKVNTVVNALNWQENFTPLLDVITPKKWKVLKVLPVKNDLLTISNQQFEHFVMAHQSIAAMSAEDNDSMTQSYLMINPQGLFYQNQIHGSDYLYSPPIIEHGVEHCLSQIEFDLNKFANRYIKTINNSHFLTTNTNIEVNHV
ncbi:MAG: radical SAM protein [Gammaproteobacteria bacterium]|nr:radical SAM protein [Gammaproteobacteria bacterium]